MRFFLNGREEWLPADWCLHISNEGSDYRATVERQGKFMPLREALALRDVETTSSRPHNKVSVLLSP